MPYDGIAYEIARRLIEKEKDEKVKKGMEMIVDLYENAGYLTEESIEEYPY